jgi:hypothetical protein
MCHQSLVGGYHRPAWRNAPAKPNICRSMVGPGRPSRSQAWGFTVPMRPRFRRLRGKSPPWLKKLHPELPYINTEVVWAVRAEMARTVEDVLARRTRALLLGARASIEAAPRVAELMARELRRDGDWQKQSVRHFEEVAQGYLPPG